MNQSKSMKSNFPKNKIMPFPIEVLKSKLEKTGATSEKTNDQLKEVKETVVLPTRETEEDTTSTKEDPTKKDLNILRDETYTDKLYKDIETVQNVVTDSLGSAYNAATENVLSPIVEQTKSIFFIEPLLGSFGEKFSPERIKKTIAKMWYGLFASLDVSDGKSSGFSLNPMRLFSGFAQNAREKLAFFDIQDVVAEHVAHKREGEVLTFNELDVKKENIPALLAMTPAERKEKTTTFIAQKRKEGELTITITGADLVGTTVVATVSQQSDAEKKVSG